MELILPKGYGGLTYRTDVTLQVCIHPTHAALHITSNPQSACCVLLSDGYHHKFDGFGSTYTTTASEITSYVWGFSFPDYFSGTPRYSTIDCSGAPIGFTNCGGGMEITFDPATCLWTVKEWEDDLGTKYYDFFAVNVADPSNVPNQLTDCGGGANWGFGGSWLITQ